MSPQEAVSPLPGSDTARPALASAAPNHSPCVCSLPRVAPPANPTHPLRLLSTLPPRSRDYRNVTERWPPQENSLQKLTEQQTQTAGSGLSPLKASHRGSRVHLLQQLDAPTRGPHVPASASCCRSGRETRSLKQLSGRGLSRQLLSVEARGAVTPIPKGTRARGTPDALLADGRGGAGLTVRVVLLAHGLRGGLAVSVLLASVVLLLAQVLLGRAWGRAGTRDVTSARSPVTDGLLDAHTYTQPPQPLRWPLHLTQPPRAAPAWPPPGPAPAHGRRSFAGPTRPPPSSRHPKGHAKPHAPRLPGQRDAARALPCWEGR